MRCHGQLGLQVRHVLAELWVDSVFHSSFLTNVFSCMRLCNLLPPALLALSAVATLAGFETSYGLVARASMAENERIARRHGEEKHHNQGGTVAPHEGTQSSSTPASHSHHDTPLAKIDEALILETHDPEIWSYFDEDTSTEGGHPGVLVSHIILSSVAFFGFLPVG